jgi:cellulose synthase/poly-beta-1,6-N-acetylglucosamine synthase-like glycosyltransferase
MTSSIGPRYSVIVPAYNEGERIADCVRALVGQASGPMAVERAAYEIIVVDDASTDDTATIARAAGADVVLTIKHGGPAVARNAGLDAARGELVLFTDADCVPMPGWIARMVAPFDDPEVVGVKGTYRTLQRGLVARLVQLEFEIRYERMAKLLEIDFIDAYAAAYRRDVLLKEGAFSTTYPVPSAEDVDLSFRLAQKGYHLRFVPDASVWHTHPDTLWQYLRRKMRFGYWRALLYMRHTGKIGGDTHTDPALKLQFALVALCLLLALGGLVWRPAWIFVLICLAGFFVTSLPFVRWAWSRDRAVAIAWPLVTLLRVVLQGVGLTAGFARYLPRWRS